MAKTAYLASIFCFSPSSKMCLFSMLFYLFKVCDLCPTKQRECHHPIDCIYILLPSLTTRTNVLMIIFKAKGPHSFKYAKFKTICPCYDSANFKQLFFKFDHMTIRLSVSLFIYIFGSSCSFYQIR